jgi:hypothetical protein
MEEKKIVTYDRLKQYDELLKEHISDETDKLNEAIAEKAAVQFCIWEAND